jgi:tellurite resistance protein TehA-like permease
MGTGIVSILLHNIPYSGKGQYWASVAIFVVNVALFIFFSLTSITRYLLYPGLWTSTVNHPVVSLSIGSYPMGLSTIIVMIAMVCVPIWGSWAATLVMFSSHTPDLMSISSDLETGVGTLVD